jgi:hypothetical protein
MRGGDFFVTTGEILLHDFRLNGAPSGGSAKLDGGMVTAEADLQWTFPLQFCELVWGDGSKTYRKMAPLAETAQFGRQRLRVTERASNAKWARFAVWDVAANGAMTQPVRFE